MGTGGFGDIASMGRGGSGGMGHMVRSGPSGGGENGSDDMFNEPEQ
jgi:hypothetical protein